MQKIISFSSLRKLSYCCLLEEEKTNQLKIKANKYFQLKKDLKNVYQLCWLNFQTLPDFQNCLIVLNMLNSVSSFTFPFQMLTSLVLNSTIRDTIQLFGCEYLEKYVFCIRKTEIGVPNDHFWFRIIFFTKPESWRTYKFSHNINLLQNIY